MREELIYIVILIGFGPLISCKENNDRKNNGLDDFESISVIYATGDEVIRSYTMMVYDTAGLIKAKFTRPDISKTKSEELVIVRTLDEDDLQMVYDFIEKAEKQSDTCSFLSTSMDRYYIKIGMTDSISIIGNCTWDGLDYSTLTKRLYHK